MVDQFRMSYSSTPMGFSRLKIGPLDESELFTTLEELLEYVKTGPSYEGQIISCEMADFTGFTIPFIIKQNYLVPIVNGFEFVTKTIGSEKYVLTAYRKSSSGSGFRYYDPMNYSIEDIESIFKFSEDSENEVIEETNPDTGYLSRYVKATDYLAKVVRTYG